MTETRLRVMYVDNDPMALGAFEVLLADVEDIELVAVTGRDVDLSEACEQHRPDAIMIDLYLDPRDRDGIAVAVALHESHPDLPTIICTSSESPADAARAWTAGICAYVTKRMLLGDLERMATVIRAVMAGHVLYHVDPRGDILARTPLSDRELDVLRRKAAGETHRHMADELCLSVRTIDSHLANIRGKLEATSMPEMLRIAAERGLVAGPG